MNVFSSPIILKKRAQALRKSTGDERYYSAIERENLHWAKRYAGSAECLCLTNVSRRLENILGRPFVMIVREPMLLAVTMYMSFIYGCVYLLFAAYPVVFTLGHHMNAGASGLMFLPLFGGGIAGVIIVSQCLRLVLPMTEMGVVLDCLQPHVRKTHCAICAPSCSA